MDLAAVKVAIQRLCAVVLELSETGAQASPTTVSIGRVMRHPANRRTRALLCFLKAVKICSTANACTVLIERGFAQEAAALFRMIAEQTEDIQFLMLPLEQGNERVPEWQGLICEEFFAEEFGVTGPKRKLNGRLASRDQMRSAIIRSSKQQDRSSALESMVKTYRAFSGYVHGTYQHIMELCSIDGKYQLNGGNLSGQDAVVSALTIFLCYATIAIEILVSGIQQAALIPKIVALRDDLFASFPGLTPDQRPPVGVPLYAGKAVKQATVPKYYG